MFNMATDKARSNQRQFAMVPPIKVQSGTPSPLPTRQGTHTLQHTSLPQLSQQRNVLTGGTPVPLVPLPSYCRSNELPNSFPFKQESLQTLSPCTLPLNGMHYLPDHSQHSGFVVPTGNQRLHRQGFSGQVLPQTTNNYLQIPNTHYHNAQSPTFSDISSIVLTSPRSPLLPPIPNLGDQFSKQPTNVLHKKPTLQHLTGLSSTSSSIPDFDDTPTTPHLNSVSSYIPDISLGISPRQSARLTTRKRAFSTSPLSDLTEFNSLIRASPNSLIPFYSQPQTIGHPAVSPNPLGGIGHLVGQISPVPPTQYTIKERKTSIEQNQNSEGTFNTTITNKVTYTEHPIAQNGQPNLFLQTAEPMDASPLLAPIHCSVESSSSTNSHYTDISSNDPVNCQWDMCMQQFSCITDLVQHIEKTHIDKGIMEDYVCLWRNCPRNRKPFNARYKLVIHLRIHSGEKPNKCTHHGCHKAFSRLENLKIHMRTHTGEKPYICQIAGCNKSFSNSSDRSKHQKTHYEQKPFACTFPGCDKRYTDPSSLRKHTRNHSQRKKPHNETSNKLDDCLLIQGLQNNIKPLDKKHCTHNDKRHLQRPRVDLQPPALIQVFPPQYPYQANTSNEHLQPPSPGFIIGSPSNSTFHNTQDMTHCSPGNTHHTYLQNHSNSPYQSQQVVEFPPHMYNQQSTQDFYIPNPKSPVIPSLSSPRPMMKVPSHTNVHYHPQPVYNHQYYNPTHLPTAQYIPNHLPPRYEDTQYMYYSTPLTNQPPVTLHHQDYSTMPMSSSMYN